MGFSKELLQRELTVVIEHPLYDGSFAFYLRAQLDARTRDAQSRLFGLTDEEREEEMRRAAVELLAALATREPDGFDDFPRDDRALRERMIEYFGDRDMEPFVSAVLAQYWQAALPRAYLRRSQNGHPSAALPLPSNEQLRAGV